MEPASNSPLNLPIASFTFGDALDFTILEANQLFYSMIGYSAEEFAIYYGNRLSAICELNDLHRMIQQLEKDLSNKIYTSYLECRIHCKGRSNQWLLLQVSYEIDSQLYLCFAFDFSRYSMENTSSILDSKKLLMALQQAQIDVFTYDAQSQKFSWHTNHAPFLPTRIKEGIGVQREAYRFIHPEDIMVALKMFASLAECPESISIKLRLKVEHSYEWFRLTLIHQNSAGEASGCYLGVLEDVSKEENALQTHMQETAIFRMMIEDVLAYGEVDVTTDRILSVSGLWKVYSEEMGKLSYGQLMAQYIKKIIHPLDQGEYLCTTSPENYKNSYAKGNRFLSCVFRRIDSNNRPVWMQVVIYLFKNTANGHLVATMYLVQAQQGEKPQMILSEAAQQQDEVESVKRLENHINQNGEIAYLLDPENLTFVCGNRAFYRHYGFNPTDCLGMKCHTLLHGKDTPCDFCQKDHWSTGHFIFWHCWNPVLEKRYLTKCKLVNFEGRLLLLSVCMDTSEADLNEQVQDAEHALLAQCGKALASARSTEQALEVTFAQLAKHYSADHICLCSLPEESVHYEYLYVWSKPDAPSLGDFKIPVLPDSGDMPFPLIQVEDLHTSAPEQYTRFSEQNIANFCCTRIPMDEDEYVYIHILNMRTNRRDNAFRTEVAGLLSHELHKQRMLERYHYNMHHDWRTGLLNRLSFEHYVRDYDADALTSLGIICADINGLKEINQQHGQEAGDRLIARLSESFLQLVTHSPLRVKAYRLNGDEFVLVLENTTLEEFSSFIRQLKEHLQEADELVVALGYTWEQDEEDVEKLLQQANNLMLINKQKYYETEKQNNDNRDYYVALQSLIEELQKGLYCVFLQPKVDLDTKALVGAEALIRYRHPVEGILVPAKFIPRLEQENLIRYVDLYVLEETCALLAKWRRHNREALPISVNFSRLTLVESGIVENVENIVSKYGIPRHLLEIEITETVGELSKSIIINVVNALKRLGYRVLLDDFGVRYTNLSIITEVNFDELKLDKGLTNALVNSRSNQMVIKNVIAMCKDLSKGTLAEGIEQPEQEQILRQFGCHKGQGYLYGKPMTMAEFETLMKS